MRQADDQTPRYRALTWINQHARSAAFAAQINSGNKGPKFICDLSDRIACEVCLTGFYDPQETILIQHLLQPGMTFVDVGANWGYFTLLAAAQVGAAGRSPRDPKLARCLECATVPPGSP